MSQRRVLLIVPPTGLYIREDRCQTPIEEMKTIALRPPIDLMYSAAAVERAGCECRLIDFPAEGLGWDDLRQCLRDFRPEILMLSITTPSLPKDAVAATVAKEIDPSILTVAKGAHFHLLDRQALELYPDIDCVIRGEYEETSAELASGRDLSQIRGLTWRNRQGAIERNPERPFIENLDSVAFPARHLAKNALYVRPDTLEMQTTVVTNRGCPHSCIYCLAPVVSGKRNRYRSTDNVVEELRECRERFGIRNFLFRSDLFTQNKKWVIELCQKIIDQGLDIEWASNSRVDCINAEMLGWMKKAGCWVIAFGIESGNQQSLDLMHKNATLDQARTALRLTRQAGIRSSIYLLMGLPWDTPQTLEDNVRFAGELDPDYTEIFYPYPFPGTALHKLAIEEGLLKEGEIPAQAYSHPAIAGRNMSRQELADWRRKSLRRIYLRPRYIYRTLRNTRSPREFLQYIKLGLVTLKGLFSGAANDQSADSKDALSRRVTD